jgi:hypothetical protein
MVLTKQDMLDLIDYAVDHIEHFNAVPMEFYTCDGIEIPYQMIWDICKYMLPDDD